MSESLGAGSHTTLGEPSRWVCDWAHLVAPGGAVLDVASGRGGTPAGLRHVVIL